MRFYRNNKPQRRSSSKVSMLIRRKLQAENSTMKKYYTKQEEQAREQEEKLKNQLNQIQSKFTILSQQALQDKQEIEELKQQLKFHQQHSMESSAQPIANKIYQSQTLCIIPDSSKKKLSKVNQLDVAHLGKLMRYRFQEKQISMDHIFDYLFTEEQINNGVLSLKELNLRLQTNPFELQEEDSFLLARYLIEENDQDYVIFDEKQCNSTLVVREIFKKLVGTYQIYENMEKFNQLYPKIARFFATKTGELKMEIEQKSKKSKNSNEQICEFKEFVDVVRDIEPNLTQQMLDAVASLNYQITKDPEKVNLGRLILKFEISAPNQAGQQNEEYIRQNSGENYKNDTFEDN